MILRVILWVLGSLVGLVVLCVLVLFFMSKRPDAGKIAGSIVIDRPASEVWTYLTEPAMLTQWVSWLVEVREEGPPGVGQKQIWLMDDPNMKERLSLIGTTARWEPDRVLSQRVQMEGGFDGHNTFTLTETDGKTHVQQNGDYKYLNGIFAIMEPLVAPQAKQKLDADLAKLKQIAEAGPPASSVPDTVALGAR